MTAAISLEEAQHRLLALVGPLEIEQVAVRAAIGRFLGAPLIARRTHPARDVSAMDGYAVRGATIPGPWRIVGRSAAGHPFDGGIVGNEAVRIATGALIPAGADAVIVQEDVALAGAEITLTGTPPAPPGRHIRRAGSDFTAGAMLLPAGTAIAPRQIALSLAAGCAHLDVHRAARVAIIDSGDELAADPIACPVHQIPASNAAMLAAMLAATPHHVRCAGPIPDDIGALVDAFEAAGDADVIVTTGGASVGDHDCLKPALARWGAEMEFWRVAIRPGKPVLVARRGRQIILGLPGNPAASFVTAFLLLLPLLRHLHGAAAPLPRPLLQPLAVPLPAGGPRREFLRGTWGATGVEPLKDRDSGALASLAAADLLIDRPAGASPLAAGASVPVYPLSPS